VNEGESDAAAKQIPPQSTDAEFPDARARETADKRDRPV
jgi:hypothetical protein